MIDTTLRSYMESARRGGVVPVVRELVADAITPVSAFAAVRRAPFAFLLESLVGGERWARYTFLGTEPAEAWRYRFGRAERWTTDEGWSDFGPAPNPSAHIARRMRQLPGPTAVGLPRFTGGAVGYLGFDVVRGFERLPKGPPDDLGLPDALLIIADTLVIIDNAFARAYVVANTCVPPNAEHETLEREFDRAASRIEVILSRLAAPPRLPPVVASGAAPLETRSPFAEDAFRAGVRRIKKYIAAGDVYQAVLSRRLDVSTTADPFTAYRCLRALNPAPYLYFLELDDMAIAGSSPEVLVRVEGEEVTVRPIAGTRPRGSNEDEDARLAEELLADEKELAEHAMLVDLGRNDVGRVAQFGSVKVTEERVIERYSHVQHIVSEVRGRLRGGLDAADSLRAAFPAGTVSGAPKLRAIEILDELEPTRRGPYAGAVGYIGWGATNMDTAIAIRTAVFRSGRAHVQAGAGIVADSDPERELRETQDKAGAVLRALELAEASRALARGG